VCSLIYICALLIIYMFSYFVCVLSYARILPYWAPRLGILKSRIEIIYVFSMVISRSKNTRTLTVEIARQAGNLPCYRHQYLPLNDLGICERVRALVPSKCPGNRPRTTCIYAGTPPRVCSLDICVLLMLYMCSLI
jgi:hypothetical protein